MERVESWRQDCKVANTQPQTYIHKSHTTLNKHTCDLLFCIPQNLSCNPHAIIVATFSNVCRDSILPNTTKIIQLLFSLLALNLVIDCQTGFGG